MRTAYPNEIWNGDQEVVRALIVIDKSISENIPIIFTQEEQGKIIHLLNTEPYKNDGFHFFTRFCQFVVYFQYDTTEVTLFNSVKKMGFCIELMYFGTSDNVNDVFDYMLKLRKSGWEERSREGIIRIARQIKADMYASHFEIAELQIKDHVNDPDSYR
jgi:hypothetical protein